MKIFIRYQSGGESMKSFKKIPYEVIEEKEIYYELYAGLMARLHKMIHAHPEDAALSCINEEVTHIWKNILSDDIDSMDKMQQIAGAYQALRSIVDKAIRQVA